MILAWPFVIGSNETDLSYGWRERSLLYSQLSSLNLNFPSTTVSGWLQRIVRRRSGSAPGSWHLEFFPASLLLFRRHVLYVRGNPPDVSTRVLDPAIPFSRGQGHDWKDGDSTGIQCCLIHGVAIGNIQVNRGWHRPELRARVGQHQHGISDSHRGMHNRAVWPLCAISHLATKGCRDELDQPGSALGE